MISFNNIATFQIRVGDINYGGHMGNDKALLLFHDARIRMLEKLGVTESNLGNGVGIILAEANVKYLKEVFLHDRLQASVSVETVSTASFILQYSFVRIADAAEVIQGSTKILAYDYERNKVARLPEELSNKLKDK